MTKDQIKGELAGAIKGCKDYSSMMDGITNYIINNYNLKKNRSVDVEMVREAVIETIKAKVVEDGEIDMAEEFGGKDG